jgi:hypothetical protein
VFLLTLLSNIRSLLYSLKARNEILHPYKTRGKITYLYTSMIMLLDRGEDKKVLNRIRSAVDLVLNYITNA